MPKRRWLSLKLRKEVGGGFGSPEKPCVICGVVYRTCVDHIVPVALGGTNERDNLQPLCEPCNLRKMHHRTNDQMREWYAANKEAIDLDRRKRLARRRRY